MFRFYDDAKPDDENSHNFKKAHHNKEILLFATAAVGLFTAVATAALVAKKLSKEFR